MEPFYKDNFRTLYQKDCRDMSELSNESVDLIATDPPYGISFMGKAWDKALPDKRIWIECLRILKPGAFAFVMSIPRADCLSRMIISLENAGFEVNFTPIFWAYASGFPKAGNISKMVDKKLGIAPLERVEASGVGFMTKAEGQGGRAYRRTDGGQNETKVRVIMPERTTLQAKALDGSYGGFQPKPSVEVIIVAMKPLSEKTFVDQALKNRKGITWLKDCKIPYESEEDKEGARFGTQMDIRGGNLKTPVGVKDTNVLSSPSGRFPANLLVSDDVLNDGKNHNQGGSVFCRGQRENKVYGEDLAERKDFTAYGDSGSFSRYFDLDAWWAKTFPFLIVPKASKSEKNKGIGVAVPRTEHGSTPRKNEAVNRSPNKHHTVKPVKLMAYLITLGSREDDVILDNFAGSGTTGVAAALLGRRCIMYEKGECETAASRCRQQVLL